MAKRPGDCGVGWRKTNNQGEYYGIALDLEALLEMTGGVVSSSVSVLMYPIVSDNPKAPDFQLKYYPKKGSGPATPERGTARAVPEDVPPLTDDDIPF